MIPDLSTVTSVLVRLYSPECQHDQEMALPIIPELSPDQAINSVASLLIGRAILEATMTLHPVTGFTVLLYNDDRLVVDSHDFFLTMNVDSSTFDVYGDNPDW